MEFLLTAVPDGRVFGLDTQTLIQIGAHFINISLLAVVLTWLLYKPVRDFMRKRADRIKGELDGARSEMSAAAELKLAYEQKIENIKSEQKAILDEARKAAAETSRQILAEANKEVKNLQARAEESIKLEWERISEEMRHTIIEVSAAMTANFVAQAIDKDAQDKMFDKTMAELEGIAWRN